MNFLASVVFLISLPVLGGQQSVPSTGAEAAVRAADAAWEKAVVAKSVEDTMRFYDAEAVTAGSQMFPAQGLESFRENWKAAFTQPGFALSWQVEKVLVLKEGTLAYSSGTWKMAGERGPYLAVWRKQADGSWKVLIDAAWAPPPSR